MEASTQREHGLPDLLVLLAVMALALATWMYLSDAAVLPLWKPYSGVTISLLLALATLTRHPYRAASIRLLTGAWIVAAPYLLGFASITPACRAYLLIGAIVATMSFPGLAAVRAARLRLAN